MSDDVALRASDADRETAAAELREHYTAGRITGDELGTRLDAVYDATTLPQLDALRADLPKLPTPAPDARAELAQRRSLLARRLLQQAGGGLGLFAVCVVVWLASGASGSFWPVWVLIVPLLFLVRNGWALYGPAPDLDRVEGELERRRRHDAQRIDRQARHRGRPGLRP